MKKATREVCTAATAAIKKSRDALSNITEKEDDDLSDDEEGSVQEAVAYLDEALDSLSNV